MAILGYNAITDSLAIDYFDLGKKVYKLLPIYEGKVKGTDTKLDKEVALNNFIKNLDVLTSEIRGMFSKVEFHKNLSEVYIALEGLKGIDGNAHEAVRNVVLHCVNLLNAIRG